MFTNEEMSVWDWLVLWIIMLVPVVNLIIAVMIILSPNSSRNLKNFLISGIIVLVVLTIISVTSRFDFIGEVQGWIPF